MRNIFIFVLLSFFATAICAKNTGKDLAKSIVVEKRMRQKSIKKTEQINDKNKKQKSLEALKAALNEYPSCH